MLTRSLIRTKNRLKASFQQGSIYCYPENDIKLDPLYIGHGRFGAGYEEETMKQNNGILDRKQNIYSSMPIAMVNIGQKGCYCLSVTLAAPSYFVRLTLKRMSYIYNA